MKKTRFLLLMLSLLLGFASVQAQEATPAVEPLDLFTLEVINSYPHDAEAFTQGLLIADGVFYESTGLEGQSSLRAVTIETGEVQQQVDLAADIFAEGLALAADQLYQITWQEGQAFVYDRATLELQQTFTYEGQGWGLCYDGSSLWMSDGTEMLRRRNAATFDVEEEVLVTLMGEPVNNISLDGRVPLNFLNELECVDGQVYANVWHMDTILRINPTTGVVTGLIDASGLLTEAERAALAGEAVLNGIAYNPETETFFVTGKLWPKIFEVRLVFQGQL